MSHLIIGSRGSDLALWQANFAKRKLAGIGAKVEIKIIKTKGDKLQHLTFDKIEGKGFFTKELEDVLLNKQIDLAVHSHKDLPTVYPPGLTIAAISGRAAPADLLLTKKENIDITQVFNLKRGAVLGTSSARRKAQILAYRPDLEMKDIRGNVPTRIDKMRQGQFDAIILAQAGVARLQIDLSEFGQYFFDPIEFIPAPAQGVLAYQVREGDEQMLKLMEKIHDSSTAKTIRIEREVLRLFDGGCQMPIGVYATLENDRYHLWAMKSKAWNTLPARVHLSSKSPARLAEKAVKALKNPLPAKVFITRDISSINLIKRILTSHGFEVAGESLVKFEAVKPEQFPDTDWIFFASKKAVRFFFKEFSKVQDVKWAALGTGTAGALEDLGIEADFIGAHPDPEKVALEFLKVGRNKRVLFPRGTTSRQTIQETCGENIKSNDLIVYSNKKKTTFQIPEAEVLIFTSPLNAEAFVENQKIDPSKKVIAIGETTAAKLKELGVTVNRVAYRPYEVNLVDEVMGIGVED